MKLRLQKWGNSLAVRIPSPLAKEAHLIEGSAIDVMALNGEIILRKVTETPEYSLRELCDAITDENRHEETDCGPSVGLERFWESE